LHHRPANTVVLTLVGHDGEELAERTRQLIPPEVRQVAMNFGDCGRFCNAIGIVQGLVSIEAMGRAVGIDPGKPGIADFGRPLYKDESLAWLSEKLGPALRQKRRARVERDDPACDTSGIHAADRERLARLSAASIGGIVFDYDGTIVRTEQRTAAPAEALIGELKRLHGLGVRLAIASGRGGSAGEMLREVLPPEMQPHILMGYYNGGYMRQLDVDIQEEPPEEAPEIIQTAAWLANRSDLFLKPVRGEHSRVQISIQLDNIPDLERFNREIATCDSIASGAVRVTRSGHSLDIILAGSSKTNVADRLAEGLAANIVVLRVGDQGSRDGNDNELLTHPFGISVKDVCGRDEGCWSLFGAHLTGPDALLRLLQALQPDVDGRVRIDTPALGLDTIA
jgi:hydroxymethylpyrimidine pyrophosphatase-like HAD family hydrolase